MVLIKINIKPHYNTIHGIFSDSVIRMQFLPFYNKYHQNKLPCREFYLTYNEKSNFHPVCSNGTAYFPGNFL